MARVTNSWTPDPEPSGQPITWTEGCACGARMEIRTDDGDWAQMHRAVNVWRRRHPCPIRGAPSSSGYDHEELGEVEASWPRPE